MRTKIYIQLLGEGTKVYRPVPSLKLGDKLYKIEGFDIYDPDDEIWEFAPGSIVIIEEQKHNRETILVAVQKVSNE